MVTTVNINNLTQTWNAIGTTFAGIKLNVTDSASAAASLLLDLQVGGVSKFSVRKDGLATFPVAPVFTDAAGTRTALGLGTSATVNTGTSGATIPLLNAANTWASAQTFSAGLTLGASGNLFGGTNLVEQRNGTNAQTFNVYNTYTDASNNEPFSFAWISNKATLLTAKAGTGTERSLAISAGATGGQIEMDPSGNVFFNKRLSATRWQVNTSGHFIAGADNTYDIGASGATRPRQIFFSPSTTGHANLNLPASGVAPTSPTDGDIWFDGTNLNIRISGATKTVNVT